MARKYRKIDPRVWRDEKFQRLNIDEKLAVFYLITAQSNRIGLYSLSPGLAAEDLGLSLTRMRVLIHSVVEKMGWVFDPNVRVLWIPTWFRYNPPENESHLRGILTDLADVPACELHRWFLARREDLPDFAGPILDSYTHSSTYSCATSGAGAGAGAGRRTPLAPLVGGVLLGAGLAQGQAEPTSTAPAAGATTEAEILWRVRAVWDDHVAAWTEYRQRKDSVPPSATRLRALAAGEVEAKPHIRRALLDFDAKLLGADQRDEWREKSQVRAAGIGIFHDRFLTADDPRNESRKEYLEHWRPWRPQRGKAHPVPRFAELYFSSLDRWQRRSGGAA